MLLVFMMKIDLSFLSHLCLCGYFYCNHLLEWVSDGNFARGFGAEMLHALLSWESLDYAYLSSSIVSIFELEFGSPDSSI